MQVSNNERKLTHISFIISVSLSDYAAKVGNNLQKKASLFREA
jgi:hypothetical protein